MGILGDVEELGGAFVDGVTGKSPKQPQYAPVPKPGNPPPPPVQPVTTTMPDASGSGQLSVNRAALRKVAAALHSDVADLDAAVAKVKSIGAGLGTGPNFPTGTAFFGNVQNICSGFGAVGENSTNTQTSAAKTLTSNAAAYDDTESSNAQSATTGIGATASASASSVNQASGI